MEFIESQHILEPSKIKSILWGDSPSAPEFIAIC